MEENNIIENTKKSNKGLIVIIIILLLIIGGLICILIKPDLINFNRTDNKETKETKKSDKKSIKEDDSKEYVYDASYEYDNKNDVYNRGFSGDIEDITYDLGVKILYKHGDEYFKDLVVPYINIDSDDAKKINKEIKEFYLDKAKMYDECAEESRDETKVSCSQVLTYKSYEEKNVLSVLIIYTIQHTAHPIFTFTTYNFDLSTGKELSFDKYLEKIGYKKDDFMVKAKTKLHESMDNYYGKFSGEFAVDLNTNCYSESGTKTCYDIADSLFEKDINDGKTVYLIGENNKPSILAIPYAEAAETTDRQYYVVPIE